MRASPGIERHAGRWVVCAAAFWLTAGAPPVARAETPGRVWLGAGVLAGSTLLDPRFSSYQWDVRPRAAWGGEVMAGRGPWVTGIRIWRATSTQSIDQPGAESADVAVTTAEVFGQRRVAEFLGADLFATASAGRLWLGYRPDQVTITPFGSSPIVVDLAPVHEWTAGAGLALRRPWSGPWSVSFAVDYQLFGLTASHMNGNEVETHRESLGDWSARLGLAWSSRRP